MYNTITLANGLRIIHRPTDSPIVYCGYQIAAGSRNESVGQEGLAHFCEHMSFKGTSRRTAMQVINCLESVGGELNAFTNKDSTVYYSAIQKEHIGRAVSLLTDIVFSSTYPQSEIKKEVDVICDEIESYNDSPAELIYDEFDNIIFAGHPLGHNILGSRENVRSFTTADAKAFTARYYVPGNAIFFCYGDIDFKRLCRLVEREQLLPQPLPDREGESQKADKLTQDKVTQDNVLKQDSPHSFSAEATKATTSMTLSGGEGREAVIIRHLGTHQAHVMIGCRAYSVHDKRRMALYLINNILGGPGMNTRLNLSLRERNGLVYTVESTMVSYGDTGIWSTYFGCDPKDVKRCLKLIRKELNRLMAHQLSERQLSAAKTQIKGQIALACDNRENFAIDFGKSFLHYGWEKDVTSLYRNIDSLTAEQLQEVAKEIFAEERLFTLVYK